MAKKVRWVGGPFDGNTFHVPRKQRSIRAGMAWFKVDLDTGGGAMVEARREEQWPIERRGWRHYVVWREIE